MKYLFPFLLLIIFGCSNRPSATDCQHFHTGEFIYEGGPGSDTRILRTADRQIEISESNGFKDEYQVIWANDCRYLLVLLSTDHQESLPIAIGDTVSTIITSVSEDSYEFRWNYEGQHYGASLKKIE